jgi:hypothetical protein
MLSAQRPNRDNWAVWLVPLFWLLVVVLLVLHDLRTVGRPTKELWQVVAGLAAFVAVYCIPLFVRTKSILVKKEGLLVRYYLRPARHLSWDDIDHVDHLFSPNSGDRLLRLVTGRGRPVLISRAMLNYDKVEELILSRPALSIRTTPKALDRWLHGASRPTGRDPSQ